jgi:tetratricopeptide (TPR) repeat protein
MLAFAEGEAERAEVLAREALELATRAEDAFVQMRALDALVATAFARGRYAAAQRHVERALTLARRLGHAWAIATELHNLAVTRMARRDYEAAKAEFEESLALFRAAANTDGSMHACHNLALIATEEGRFDVAAAYFAQPLSRAAALDPRLVLDCVLGVAALGIEVGEYLAAGRLLAAYEALLPTAEHQIEPVEARVRARARKRLHACLDEQHLQQALNEGRAMTLDQTVEDATRCASCFRASGERDARPGETAIT